MTHYPIGQLILAALGPDRRRRIDTVRRLGYTNITKGLRRLDAAIAGDPLPEMVPNLSAALGVDQAAVDEAVQLTAEMKAREAEAQERAEFRPHIFIDAAGPREINLSILAITGGIARYRHIPLPPEVEAMPIEQRLVRIGEIVAAHYREANGMTIGFGPITGYRYRRTYEQSYRFSVEGRVLDTSDEPIFEGRVWVRIGHKTLGSLFE